MPALDLIKVPERTSFDDAAGFYATIFHEMIHATMHKSRCNRVDAAGHAFGSKGYAAEELCAEQGAWMLALALGVPFEPQHSASYLSSWSEVFPTKEDKLFALNNSFKAASEALMWIEKKALEAGVLQHQESGESEQLEAA
jgi:antirestriction protein ArdC